MYIIVSRKSHFWHPLKEPYLLELGHNYDARAGSAYRYFHPCSKGLGIDSLLQQLYPPTHSFGLIHLKLQYGKPKFTFCYLKYYILI